MVEVQIELLAPQIGLIDEIKTILNEKGMELLSYLPLFGKGEKKEHRSDKLFELSAAELFQEFYKTKFPQAQEMPDELRLDFAELLEKVRHASDKT
jgi:hypothetical protein